MSFGESYSGEGGGDRLEHLDAFFMDDGMDPLPNAIEVDTFEDVINQTGLSPDALEQYRTLHTAE